MEGRKPLYKFSPLLRDPCLRHDTLHALNGNKGRIASDYGSEVRFSDTRQANQVFQLTAGGALFDENLHPFCEVRVRKRMQTIDGFHTIEASWRKRIDNQTTCNGVSWRRPP